MPKKPLPLVTALAICDYLLWNWSSEGKSAVIALISGLALAPLLLALTWLVLLTLARLILLRPPKDDIVQSPARRRLRPRPRRLRTARAAESDRDSDKLAA
ncbi:MAG: hypothetical protein ACYCU0_15885 [Solirubrobacteraceae bacterium]